jgi:hypothetical protein
MSSSSGGAARRRTALLLPLAATVLLLAGAHSVAAGDEELPTNLLVGRVRVSSEAEAAVAGQLIKALFSASREVVTGEEDDLVLAAAAPDGADEVDVSSVATKVLASALVSSAGGTGRQCLLHE